MPASIGVFRRPEMATQPRRGVIYAVAPSPKDVNVIWAGTDDGLIHVTKDGGKNWKNVTPPAIDSWSKISQIDASHFDVNTAYVAVNRIRLDDQKPHIYRTTDGGTTWKEIVNGLPDGPVNTVKEDPQRPGLLFAGTELASLYSFNNGDSWQSLRLNMPATSIRDLVIHNDDVVVGTHGRSFWILDDITPLRQLQSVSCATRRFICLRRKSLIELSATSTPTRRCRRKNPPDKTHLTARSSTITSTKIRRRRSRSRSSTAGINSFVVFRVTTNRRRSIRTITRCRLTGFGRRKCSAPKPECSGLFGT